MRVRGLPGPLAFAHLFRRGQHDGDMRRLYLRSSTGRYLRWIRRSSTGDEGSTPPPALAKSDVPSGHTVYALDKVGWLLQPVTSGFAYLFLAP